MPELPEVESVATMLRETLIGHRLERIRIDVPKLCEPSAAAVRRAVCGGVLQQVHRHGKYMILSFADDRKTSHLMIHLRMSGQFFVQEGYIPDKHVHLRLEFEHRTVYYRDVRKFGRFTLVDHPQRPSAIDHVGPDMLSVGFRDWDRRAAHRRAPWKAVLLDQGVAAGIGNIYADESLFLAGLHPLATPAGTAIEDRRRLLRACKSVLRLAIRHGGTTFLDFVDFNGKPGNFRRRLRVFQRQGDPCRDCGTRIERIRVAGRSTHFCPRCQSRPSR